MITRSSANSKHFKSKYSLQIQTWRLFDEFSPWKKWHYFQESHMWLQNEREKNVDSRTKYVFPSKYAQYHIPNAKFFRCKGNNSNLNLLIFDRVM